MTDELMKALSEAREYFDIQLENQTLSCEAKIAIEKYGSFATLALAEIKSLNERLSEIITLSPGRGVHCIGCSLPEDIAFLSDIIKRAREENKKNCIAFEHEDDCGACRVEMILSEAEQTDKTEAPK